MQTVGEFKLLLSELIKAREGKANGHPRIMLREAVTGAGAPLLKYKRRSQ